MSDGTTTASHQLTLDFAPCFRDHVTLVPIEDEAILYEDGIGTLHQLNPTAAILCSLFDGELTLSTLVDDLHAVVQEDRERIASDVLALAQDLANKGLFEGVGPPTLDADADTLEHEGTAPTGVGDASDADPAGGT